MRFFAYLKPILILAFSFVLFNRQPSLHKMSMMCHRVRLMPYSSAFSKLLQHLIIPISLYSSLPLESLSVSLNHREQTSNRL